MRGSVTICTRRGESASSIAPRNINLDVSLVANRLEGGAWKYGSEQNKEASLNSLPLVPTIAPMTDTGASTLILT